MPDLLAPDLFPIGAVAEFSGTLASIPRGWQLCDGTNGTPDLHDKFLRGAPAGNEAGTTGGESTHVLTLAEFPSHNHSFGQGSHTHNYNEFGITSNGGTGGVSTRASSFNSASSGVTLGNTGGGGAHENKPAYFELAYITRVF